MVNTASVSSSAITVLLVLVIQRFWADEWRPTGNGKTIVNTRTGELRNSFTGATIDSNAPRMSELEVAERDRLRSAALKGASEFEKRLSTIQRRRAQLSLPALVIPNEDRALWLLDAPPAIDLTELPFGARPLQP